MEGGLKQDNHFARRHGVDCAGAHLIVDLYFGDPTLLADETNVEACLRRCVEYSGATLLHIFTVRLKGGRVKGVAVLAESHIALHTDPLSCTANLDSFMCGQANPDVTDIVRKMMGSSMAVVTEIQRGANLAV